MLSTQGEAYAKARLSNGYLGLPKAIFDRHTRHGVVSFGNAENFLMRDEMLEYIRSKAIQNLDQNTLTYHEGPFGPNRLRTAMSRHLKTYFHPATPIDSSHIVFANGVTSLNAMCAISLTNPGEGILLGQPIYGSFAGDLRTPSGCELIYTPFHGDDQFSPTAVSRYEEALIHAQETGVAVKALLICNPHNPLALMRFCQKYRLHLISDEVYALSVYGDGGHQKHFSSALSIDLDQIGVDPDLVHVLYGMSKDFAMAGLRLGCLVSRSQGLLGAALSMSRFHWPSNVSCSIAASFLEDQVFLHSFLQKSQHALKSQHRLATAALEEAGSLMRRAGIIAGFFLWVDLSKCLDPAIVRDQGGWAAELDLSRRLGEVGVDMSSGYAYHNEVPGWYRVIFTVDAKTLEEGLSRIINFYHASN
ncbi:acc synthase [Aspergillus heteromorphus CBS 117.55]|uniref:Acc synthase n=1 Tax=Aspergillus heteromorphus CBS 117.55 TaxID=1448321 RepID=A0A317WA01_9EURO|nr:acc synthase [Aspergillus heteromorphus CBS 117.55]PWY82152.1 acc synthase [Aspergillus heteromorphus CBS 117.55]